MSLSPSCSWSDPEITDTAVERFMGDKDNLTKLLILFRETTTAAEFLPCIYVCKRWANIAVDLLYSVVTLTDTNLTRFLSATNENSRGPLPIISLTVHVTVSWPNGSNPSGMSPELFDLRIQELGTVIENDIHELESFSFFVDDASMRYQGKRPSGSDDEPDLDDQLFWPSFKSSSIEYVIRQLPITIKSIEIDTSGHDISPGDDHLCPALVLHAPQLQHLRLRLRQICMDFLPAQSLMTKDRLSAATKLRTLIINCEVDFQSGRSTQPCSSDNFATEVDIKHPLRSLLHDYSCFPEIERLEIFERLNDHPNGPIQLRSYIILSRPGKIAQSQCFIHKQQHPDIRDAVERAWRFTEFGARLPEYPGATSIRLTGNLLGHILELSWRDMSPWLAADLDYRWTDYVPAVTMDETFEIIP